MNSGESFESNTFFSMELIYFLEMDVSGKSKGRISFVLDSLLNFGFNLDM